MDMDGKIILYVFFELGRPAGSRLFFSQKDRVGGEKWEFFKQGKGREEVEVFLNLLPASKGRILIDRK
jgi:hypothetical protein